MTATALDAHRRRFPDFPWLDLGEPATIGAYLAASGWLEDGERVVGVAPAGAGNMNLTVRVRTDRRSVVLKQARPWVEKYAHIPAPWERMAFEQRFYHRVGAVAGVGDRLPAVLGVDPAGRTMLLEDLPGARDLTGMYAGDPPSVAERVELGSWLRALHDATEGAPDPAFANHAMRALNHEHLFVVPLAADSGLRLDAFEPGLSAAAARLRADRPFVDAVARLGARYLADGPCLLHGDYFPGSWLRTARGLRIIDPEFCRYGAREIDVGGALGHLALAAQPAACAMEFLQAYEAPGRACDPALVAGFAGVETVRRLIGVAQLPLETAPGARAAMLDRARDAVVAGRPGALFG